MIELMRELDGLHADYRLLLGESANRMMAQEESQAWFYRHAIQAPREPRALSLLRNETALRRLAGEGGLVHRTYHPRLDLLPRRVGVIETVHDLWDHYYGDARSPRVQIRRHVKRRALHRADRIVCVSQFTQDRLIELWPMLAERSIVIHHGVRPFPVGDDVQATATAPYFLFVGKRDLYKNFDVVLRALSGAKGLSDFALVCFGGGALTYAEEQRIRSLGLSGRVQLETGPDALLGQLYRNAAALLYPSRHEGFGLPLLEAMICDCPVITSPCTSLPEVAGEAALYADPDEPEAWNSAMEQAVFDNLARADLVAAGRMRVSMFSWRQCAQSHIELYSELL